MTCAAWYGGTCNGTGTLGDHRPHVKGKIREYLTL
jgi:hypothetical protein